MGDTFGDYHLVYLGVYPHCPKSWRMFLRMWQNRNEWKPKQLLRQLYDL